MRMVSPDMPSVFPTEYSLCPTTKVSQTSRGLESAQTRHVPLLRVLEHLPLRAQVAKHRLPSCDILVQRRVGARKEILLPQRVLLPTHILPSHTEPPAATTTTAPVPRVPGTKRRRRLRAAAATVGVRVLGRVAAGVGPPVAQQLAAVAAVQGLVARALGALELAAVRGELGAEAADALARLVLLGRVELLAREGVVLVDGALEGGERGREGAEGRGAGDAGWGGGGGGVGGWLGGEGREGREVFADRGALLESTVEDCVLLGLFFVVSLGASE